MLPPIPKELYRLYSDLKFWERWHVKWRWRLCPFLTLAGHITSSGKIVDIGCGRGLLANYLALTGPSGQVIGIDKQEKRIEAARSSVKGRTNIHFRLQDGLDLKYEEFDVIVMSDFLHHLDYDQQGKLLNHCFRILPERGLLLIEEVGNRPLWKWISHFLIDRFLNFGSKQYYRSSGEWINLMKLMGFGLEIWPAHKHLPLPDILLVCRKGSDR